MVVLPHNVTFSIGAARRRRGPSRTCGGYFALWEQPEIFAAELRAAFRTFRQS